MKHKRKKISRMRGRRWHGFGAGKKHRGKGSRGGTGMAGSGKRADVKKPTILKLYGNAYYGKRGFHRPQKVIKQIRAINIIDLPKFNKTEINLTELGYDKLLGKGKVKQKYNIKVKLYSKSAKEKIEKAGGKIE